MELLLGYGQSLICVKISLLGPLMYMGIHGESPGQWVLPKEISDKKSKAFLFYGYVLQN